MEIFTILLFSAALIPVLLILILSLLKIDVKVTMLASVVAAAAIIACNQTLTIMLTHQVCGTVEPDAQQFAVDLGDTAVVLAPLVPWSIAGAVPLASIGAPTVCLAAACYLYALPLWQLLVRSISAKKQAAHVLEK